MWRSLAYYFYALKFPSLKRYISEGFGIEARRSRANKFWAPHIKCCAQFQQKALEDYSRRGTLLILGAGRLYDVDTHLVKSKFDRVILIDIDPSCLPFWRRAFHGFPFEPLFLDISGSYEAWEKSLHEFCSQSAHLKEESLVSFLRELRPLFPSIPKCDVIFSMNLLGQIPLSWRDTAHEVLENRFKIECDDNGKLPPEIEEALCGTYLKLQEGHLFLLSSSLASRIVIISDESFMYYQRELALWERDSALHVKLPIMLPGFDSVRTEGWFWHLAPQGVEFKDHGVIHDILALDLRRE